MAWAAFNGAGLAFVLPCAQSILADYYIPEQRGRAFGFMFTLAALGKIHGFLCALLMPCQYFQGDSCRGPCNPVICIPAVEMMSYG